MIFILKLDTKRKKSAVLAVFLLLCAALTWVVISHFVVRTLSDEGFIVLRSTLLTAATYFPRSARLQARLAKVELAEALDETDVARAEVAALSASRLSPWSSNNRLLLASVRNLQGDLNAAETSMREAVRLAPHSAQVHWQLANLLVRQDKLDAAIKEFQLAVASDSGAGFLPGTIDIVWNLSDGNAEKLSEVVGDDPQKRLTLAQYFLKKSRVPEAVTIYKSIEKSTLLNSSSAIEFLNSLVTIGQLELARDLWGGLVGAAGEGLYNGGFEKELVPALSQFDWKVASSEYAILSFDTAITHSGKRSLRLTLTGRDTTLLGKELNQTVIVKPEVPYRLECYVRTDRLITTQAPYIVVQDSSTLTPLADSKPIPIGSNDWQLYTLDFVAPSKSKAVLISIKRTPRFSYDEPSKGSLWFDDFALHEIEKNK